MEPILWAIVRCHDTWTYFGSLTLTVRRGIIQHSTQEGVLFGITQPLTMLSIAQTLEVFIKARRLVLLNGPVTPEIYLAIAIAWTIAGSISCIVTATNIQPITPRA